MMSQVFSFRFAWALVILLGASIIPLTRSAGADSSPEAILQTAKKQLQAKCDADAEQVLRDYLRSAAKSDAAAEARLLLGQVLANQKRVDEALRALAAVATSHPGTLWAALALEESIRLYELRRNSSMAQQKRDELLKYYPENPVTLRVWAGVAEQLFAEGRYEAAVGVYEKIGNNLPANSMHLFTVAKALSKTKGDPAKLLPLANEALDQNNLLLAKPLYEHLAKSPHAGPAMPQIETQLGWCLYLEGGHESLRDAERLWQRVISRTRPGNPWYAESRWHLVQLAAGPQGDWSKAVAICEEIAKEQATGSLAQEQALFARAWLLTVHKQWKAALAAFDDLAAAFPEKLLHPPVQRYWELAQQGAQTEKGML